MGATYVVVAPEHPLAVSLGEKNSAVAQYIRETASKSDLDRTMAKTKTGVVSCE